MLLMKQVRKGGCKDGSAPYMNQWCNGPVCEPSRWALDAKRWGLGAIDEMGEKGWEQNDGGWAAVPPPGAPGGGVQGWVCHTRIDGALGLFVNQTGGHWAQNNGGWALLMKRVRKGGCKDGSVPYTN